MKVESLNHNFPMPFFRFAEQAKDRICEHPLLRKVARKANGAFHAGQTIPASISSLAQRCVATVQDVTKTCITSTAELALLAIDTLVFPHPAMKNHAFTPRQCNGGRLYYDGDVPILTLTADDPFLAGMAHGYLCGEAINRLSKRFSLALHSFAKQPRPGDVPHMLATVRRTVSPKYLKEMEGLVEGYNKWAREQHWWILPKTITVDDVLLFHSKR